MLRKIDGLTSKFLANLPTRNEKARQAGATPNGQGQGIV